MVSGLTAAGKMEHSTSMSLQERNFCNPTHTKNIETEDHYISLPNSEDFYAAIGNTEDIYAIPDSPPLNIYEQLGEHSREEDIATHDVTNDGDMTYSVVLSWSQLLLNFYVNNNGLLSSLDMCWPES